MQVTISHYCSRGKERERERKERERERERVCVKVREWERERERIPINILHVRTQLHGKHHSLDLRKHKDLP